MRSPVQDYWNRPIRDLRISVTDRCNFRCSYCMPKEVFGDDYVFLPKQELLSFEEIKRVTEQFAKMGVKKIRLTGGEPLMRQGLPELIRQLFTIPGIEDMGLTTNGLLLGKKAHDLYDAGLRRLNISLDSLDSDTFGQLNGRGIAPSHILKNIDLATEIGFEVKVNMVVQKGINDRHLVPMTAYFKERGVTLRFIEFMDVGTDNKWSFEKVVTKKEILMQLEEHFDLVPAEEAYFGEVAKRYRFRDGSGQIGFITSVSESFCSSCTRARLSSDGKFYTCLFATEGFDVRALVRSELTDDELYDELVAVWTKRRDRYSDERTEETAKSRKKIGMSYIGG
ncbi:GTP 3',8-cyclase MoaA [Metasolibacillus sp.]|uniref:GTP 3',8-cyclase MoaA n=1 Tax=Metasolibacillus sp. TaxID=2703680 RepID=UPI0025F5FDFB|nr:GTP 3',8-cyclase MoaA [Metasolibacillus sp.]MCT6924274.1 GTP 3',8-cyclase MoaA [Metasolibacillus sp.]MCT6940324.1 GTP 3',8-cyclase MoaA [Metasolibacillus sp.]